MDKKKASVILPGGIAGLVQNAQYGIQQQPQQPQQPQQSQPADEEGELKESAADDQKAALPTAQAKDNGRGAKGGHAAAKSIASGDKKVKSAGAAAKEAKNRAAQEETNNAVGAEDASDAESRGASGASERVGERTPLVDSRAGNDRAGNDRAGNGRAANTRTTTTRYNKSRAASDGAAGNGSVAAEGADERAYSLTPKNNADESWQLFLDLAKTYKQRQAPIATIYIDEDLKRVLDRLKTAGPSRLSTTSIVSSIVARFIYDHEREIKELLYKEI